jgi:predicted DNA binding CopG/RHH family protein
MARPKTKTNVGLRVPTEALNRLKELAAENKVSLYQFLTDILVNASKTPTAQDLESDLAEAFTFGEAE